MGRAWLVALYVAGERGDEFVGMDSETGLFFHLVLDGLRRWFEDVAPAPRQ